MPEINIQCPAKINYSLKVTAKRPDGFHNIESIMQTISLYDYLKISVEPCEKNVISLSGSSALIPYDEKNLVYKAGMLFLGKLNTDKSYKISVYIEKNIPVSAGLAGGSTNAAGMLFGVNELLNQPFSRNELHLMAAELGSDLNFCLEGGCKMASGRGEILEDMPVKDNLISLIKPIDLGISAKEAYTKFSQKLSAGLPGRDNFVNDLEWAVIDDYEQLQTIKSLYPDSVMSGSGSTYYIIGKDFKHLDGFWICNGLKTTSCGVMVI